MGNLQTIALTLFDYVMTLLFVHSIKKTLRIRIIPIILYIVVASVLIALVNFFQLSDILSHILCTIISIVALYMYFYVNQAKNAASCAMIYFTISLMMIVLQLAGVVILNQILGNVEYTFSNGLLSQIVCLVFVLVLTRFVPFSLFDIYIEDRNPVFSVIMTASFVLSYGITILWYIDVSNITNVILEIILVVLFAIVINTIVLREGFVSRNYKEKLAIYDTYFPIIDDMIEEIRGKQHDYHNQIQTILAMKRDEVFTDKSIEDYIDEINSNNIWKDLLKLDNKIISAFLYSKMLEIMNKEIKVKLTIQDFTITSSYNSHQLVEMYGILIDNAIEAIESMNIEGELELLINRDNEINIFEVRNTYRYVSVAEINNYFSYGYTTKGNAPRGIGLHKLKKMLEHKKGTIDFYYDTTLSKVVAKICHY
ncbi:MAG: GHKL domain-containing protein [Mobilitalea sp.]